MSTERARSLRKRMSPPEARMWNVLRREPFESYHFRRQVPLGRYYADFEFHTAKLVVEIDGGSHFTEGALQHDAARDEFLAAEGYSILRLTTSEVLANLDAVAAALLARLGPTLQGREMTAQAVIPTSSAQFSPLPPPRGEGGSAQPRRVGALPSPANKKKL